MKTSLLPLMLTVSGGVLYHLSQKSVPRGVSPFAAVIIAYLVGILFCLGVIALYPDQGDLIKSLRESNWAVYTLGAGAVIIEIGFLLTYRAGWDISVASVICNISVALLLLPIGRLVFGEQITLRSVAGVVLCLFGLYLVSNR